MLREKLWTMVDQYEKPFKVGMYLVVIVLMAGIVWVRAAPPTTTISYQGYLTDTSGRAVSGNLNMNVAFYDAAAGGANPYAEDHANVTVARGQFDLELGAGTPTVGTWGGVDFSQALWLEITADGETFAPRIPLSAVPYARYAFQTAALAANGANCSSGQAPLGVDDSGAVESCFDVATQTELNTHTNLTTAHGATSTNTASRIVMRDGSGNFSAGTITANLTGSVTGNVTGNASTATALAANGANCSSGQAPLGVDDSGVVESCFDVATQTELNTHANLTTAHGATNANTASTIVMRDGSGNFSAGTITANVTGNASTATALAANGSNCAAGNYPLGVDASGNVEGCTAAGGGGGITAKVGVNNQNAATITVSCPAGTTTATGGGCRQTAVLLYQTEPSCGGGGGGSCSDGGTNMDGWFCEFSGANASNTAYVICY